MTELLLFAGRFHPLLVHLPIGTLLLAAMLEAAAWVRRRRRRGVPGREPSRASAIPAGINAILALGAAMAVAAAVPGYLLGVNGPYAGPTFEWHLRLGTLVAIASVLTAIAGALRQRRPASHWPRTYGVLLTATIVLLAAAGHLGATLAHGEGYLTEHAPSPLKRAFARIGGGDAVRSAVPADQAVVYTALVAPVLQARCVSCHGPSKAEGGLRLDTPDGIRAGGSDGAVIAAGRAGSSELVTRIWLPSAHPDVMPPRGHRPPTPAEASLLRWWIDQGASFDARLADVEVDAQIAPIVEALVGPLASGPTMPRVQLGPPAAEAIAAARQAGLSVTPVADGSAFVDVHCTNLGRACDDGRVRVVEKLGPHVLWLDLGGTGISDAGLDTIARLPNLTRLQLQRTEITDAGLRHLRTLPHLESLNLYGTRVTDAGLAHLEALGTLRTLYVWETGVTDAGAARLQARLPRLTIDRGVTTGHHGVRPRSDPGPEVRRTCGDRTDLPGGARFSFCRGSDRGLTPG